MHVHVQSKPFLPFPRLCLNHVTGECVMLSTNALQTIILVKNVSFSCENDLVAFWRVVKHHAFDTTKWSSTYHRSKMTKSHSPRAPYDEQPDVPPTNACWRRHRAHVRGFCQLMGQCVFCGSAHEARHGFLLRMSCSTPISTKRALGNHYKSEIRFHKKARLTSKPLSRRS